MGGGASKGGKKVTPAKDEVPFPTADLGAIDDDDDDGPPPMNVREVDPPPGKRTLCANVCHHPTYVGN